jgi:hypothetical protein
MLAVFGDTCRVSRGVVVGRELLDVRIHCAKCRLASTKMALAHGLGTDPRLWGSRITMIDTTIHRTRTSSLGSSDNIYSRQHGYHIRRFLHFDLNLEWVPALGHEAELLTVPFALGAAAIHKVK